jgi:hypothetical protein
MAWVESLAEAVRAKTSQAARPASITVPEGRVVAG